MKLSALTLFILTSLFGCCATSTRLEQKTIDVINEAQLDIEDATGKYPESLAEIDQYLKVRGIIIDYSLFSELIIHEGGGMSVTIKRTGERWHQGRSFRLISRFDSTLK